MGKNIVICCDGTGNEVESNLSNVLKLFRILRKNADQRVYYNPGIGTIGTNDAWTRITQNTKSVFELATGYGLDDEILSAYRFVAENHEPDDRLFLFGFSRGAYTVRALAAFIHMVGLLHPDQLNIANYALSAYKKTSETSDFQPVWQFGKVANARPIIIDLLGVWDTVASMIVPRWDRGIPIPTLQMLPYTRRNSSVKVFRHAKAVDERRRLFRLNRWQDPQDFIADPFHPQNKTPQDIKQVWFAGVHADIGGGYPETGSALSKYPLNWMIDEAVKYGLNIVEKTRDHIALGQNSPGDREMFVAPDPTAALHDSMTAAWKPLEWLPKRTKYEEWKWRLKLDGLYIPDSEPRPFALWDPFLKDEIEKPPPRVHQSVVDRLRLVPDYRPPNLVPEHDIEPWPHRIGSCP
ncbi:MAG TPA: DUF2235 domain-containing protein [Xanthobacteraceae bacterium]|nr:DUF2235 domain-containing protein [Xanthobacteraceae bacterium]